MLYVHYNTSTSPAEAFLSFVRTLFVASQRDSLPFGGYEGRGKKKHTQYSILYILNDENSLYKFSPKSVWNNTLT